MGLKTYIRVSSAGGAGGGVCGRAGPRVGVVDEDAAAELVESRAVGVRRPVAAHRGGTGDLSLGCVGVRGDDLCPHARVVGMDNGGSGIWLLRWRVSVLLLGRSVSRREKIKTYCGAKVAEVSEDLG